MTVVLPRLNRETATALIAQHVASDPATIAESMPIHPPTVTYSPTGGVPIGETALRDIRAALVTIAREHGWPNAPVHGTSEFEGKSARVLHRSLPMTPHEASHDEIWSYLTCCWLLDIAVWRFGSGADERRFIGNINRNTFRRMWWRAEVLGDNVDLTLFGEDELVAIMERPTIASDRRLARAVAAEFLQRAGDGERMQLMRDAMKRLLRLTPIVAFTALGDSDLEELVEDTFDAASAGLRGESVARSERELRDAPPQSPDVESVTHIGFSEPLSHEDARLASASRIADLDTVGEVALDIARRTGRVTNMSLREVIPITAEEAREVFAVLMVEGALARRGVKRGTYYVLGDARDPEALTVTPSETASGRESADSGLRRFLRRG